MNKDQLNLRAIALCCKISAGMLRLADKENAQRQRVNKGQADLLDTAAELAMNMAEAPQ